MNNVKKPLIICGSILLSVVLLYLYSTTLSTKSDEKVFGFVPEPKVDINMDRELLEGQGKAEVFESVENQIAEEERKVQAIEIASEQATKFTAFDPIKSSGNESALEKRKRESTLERDKELTMAKSDSEQQNRVLTVEELHSSKAQQPINSTEKKAKKSSSNKIQTVLSSTATSNSDDRNSGAFSFIEAETAKPSQSAIETESQEFQIPVRVYGNHVIKTGDKVVMRTIEDAVYKGQFIPRNTMITSFSAMSSDRLVLKVRSIQTPNGTIKLSLSAHDTEGSEGIFINFNEVSEATAEGGLDVMEGLMGAASTLPGGGVLGIGSTILQGAGNVARKKVDKVLIRDGQEFSLQ